MWFSNEKDRWKTFKMLAQRNITKIQFLSLMSRKINFKLISIGLSAKTNWNTPFFYWTYFSTSNICQDNSEKWQKMAKNERV